MHCAMTPMLPRLHGHSTMADLQQHTRIAGWYGRMEKVVGPRALAQEAAAPEQPKSKPSASLRAEG